MFVRVVWQNGAQNQSQQALRSYPLPSDRGVDLPGAGRCDLREMVKGLFDR